MTALVLDPELLAHAVARLPADALMPARRQALTEFVSTGFPSAKQEDWRYTSLKPVVELCRQWLERDMPAAPDPTAAAHARAGELTGTLDAAWLVIANGATLASPDLPGVTVSSMASSGPTALPGLTDDPLSRFNAALLRDAVHIRVDPETAVERPLGLLFIDDPAGSALSQARVVLEVGAGASLEVFEQHASIEGSGQFANTVLELTAEPGAAIDLVRLQHRHEDHYGISRLTARLAQGARLDHAAFDLGGALIRNDIAVDLAGPDASVRLHGLYAAGGEQHVDNHTRVDHRVGPAASREEYRGILRDRARAVFNGKAVVHPGADGTDAHQANHNLLLSEGAEVDTKPELEIYADDVRCSHGTTVGQLDAAALFYLRSRGLARDVATHVLTRAFAAVIVAACPVEAARGQVEAAVADKLRQLVDGSRS